MGFAFPLLVLITDDQVGLDFSAFIEMTSLI